METLISYKHELAEVISMLNMYSTDAVAEFKQETDSTNENSHLHNAGQSRMTKTSTDTHVGCNMLTLPFTPQ